ncbi:MAG TPA: hypothetical protein VM286_01635 [Candidatus Thermoplasmatota archaeon]|nr:hypothetical protein [Candidatus Thermoplasmatota archaeon]
MTGYNVYRVNGTTKQILSSLPDTITVFNDSQVAPLYVYSYFVTSISVAGESSPSNLAGPIFYPWCWDIVIFPGPEINDDCLLPPPDIIPVVIHGLIGG